MTRTLVHVLALCAALAGTAAAPDAVAQDTAKKPATVKEAKRGIALPASIEALDGALSGLKANR